MVERVTGGKALPAEVLEQILARDRRRAAVRRGADQDGARVRPARGRGRPLRAGRAAAAAGDPGDAAGLAHGPARPPGAGQGGGADRRRASAASSPTSCSPRWRRCRRRAAATRSTSWSAPSWSSAAARRRDATYSFKHALVQDAAYQSLLKSRRQQLHARIAEVLEEHFPEVAETRAGAARAPLRRGGPGRAGDRLLAPGRRAGRRALGRSRRRSRTCAGLELLEDAARRAGAARRRSSTLQLALGGPLIATQGYRRPGGRARPTGARASCASSSAIGRAVPGAVRAVASTIVRGRAAGGAELAERAPRPGPTSRDAAARSGGAPCARCIAVLLGEFASGLAAARARRRDRTMRARHRGPLAFATARQRPAWSAGSIGWASGSSASPIRP